MYGGKTRRHEACVCFVLICAVLLAPAPMYGYGAPPPVAMAANPAHAMAMDAADGVIGE